MLHSYRNSDILQTLQKHSNTTCSLCYLLYFQAWQKWQAHVILATIVQKVPARRTRSCVLLATTVLWPPTIPSHVLMPPGPMRQASVLWISVYNVYRASTAEDLLLFSPMGHVPQVRGSLYLRLRYVRQIGEGSLEWPNSIKYVICATLWILLLHADVVSVKICHLFISSIDTEVSCARTVVLNCGWLEHGGIGAATECFQTNL